MIVSCNIVASWLQLSTCQHQYVTEEYRLNVSVNSNWVHPLGNPRGLAQKTCLGGQDLTFESCLGARNSTRTGILWKMKVKLHRNSVDQIFTDENKNKLNFLGLHVLSMEFFVVYGSIIWFCYHTYLTKNLRSRPWLVYIWSFHSVMVIHTYFCTKGCDYSMLNVLSVYWFY